MKIWTLDEALQCAERELKRRRERYPPMVKAGKLELSESEYEIAAMQYVCDVIKDRIITRDGYPVPESVKVSSCNSSTETVSQMPFPLKIEDLKPEVQEGLGFSDAYQYR